MYSVQWVPDAVKLSEPEMFVRSQVIVECVSTCFAAGGLSSVLSVAKWSVAGQTERC